MSMEILFVLPVLIIVALIVLFLRGENFGGRNILPMIMIAFVSVILIGSLLMPAIEEANADTSVTYDDYIEIDEDSEVSGVFEKITIGDVTYAHADGVGKGKIDGEYYDVQKAKLDVFMIMGQSNAAYAYYDTSTASPIAKLGQTYYYGTETQPVTQSLPGTGMYDAVNLDGTAKIGHLEMPFMAKYNELTDHKVYTINTGWIGANISILTVGGSHYGWEQRTANAGFNAINQDYYDVDMVGFIWLQGESDAGLGTPIEQYKADFLKLFDALNHTGSDVFSRLFTIDHAFIVQTRTARGENVAEALDQLAEENEDIYMATDVTLTFTVDNGYMRSDDLHYSQSGFNVIGVDVAEFIASKNFN